MEEYVKLSLEKYDNILRENDHLKKENDRLIGNNIIVYSTKGVYGDVYYSYRGKKSLIKLFKKILKEKDDQFNYHINTVKNDKSKLERKLSFFLNNKKCKKIYDKEKEKWSVKINENIFE